VQEDDSDKGGSMSWENVAELGVAGAIVVAVLLITGSTQAVPVVIGALLVLVTGLGGDSRPDAGRVRTLADQGREVTNSEARA
jgi:hypothetical protein